MPFQEVLTMHVRAISGEHRVQALGEVIQASVCQACLADYIARKTDEKRMKRQLLVRHGLISLTGAGLLLLTQVPAIGRATLLPGVFVLGFGLIGYFKALKDGRERLKRLAAMDEAGKQQTLLPAFIRHQLPGKAGENDLSYIPLTDSLAGLDLPALMSRYGLLKDIAQQLKDRQG